MKKAIFGVFIFSLLLISCNVTQDIGKQGNNTGSLLVNFDLNNTDTKAINYDFTQVNSGKVFLQQGGSIKYQANMNINTPDKTGSSAISNIIIGNYDVIIELYDSASNVVYSGTSTAIINSDSNSTVTMQLSKDIGILTVNGNWTEGIPDLASAIVQLKKNSVASYASNLILDTNSKTVTGGIINIQPGSYDIYVEIKNTTGMVCFTGTQTIIITKKNNSVTLTLAVKTGSIIISITGDVTAPVITSGPTAAINGQDVTITWTTNENAASNVCYSVNSGFNYQIATDWAPVGQDLIADNTSHSVTIHSLVQEETYYYVVVSADAEGNMIVSDEKSFVLASIPRNGLVGEWLFDGNANDTSGNENNGIVNGPTITTDRFGDVNKAYNFNNNYIDVGNPNNNILDLDNRDFTISVWVKFDSIIEGRDNTFLGKDAGNGPENKWEFMYSAGWGTDHTSCFHINDTNSIADYNIKSGNWYPNVTEWYHMTIVKENISYKFYRNGISDGTINSSIIIPDIDHSLYIGYGEPGHYFNGKIDDVRIYNRALSNIEIDILYHEGGLVQ